MSKFNFTRVLANMATVKSEIGPVLGNTAQNYFVNNFNQQGFDNGARPWQEVKRRIPGTKAYEYPKTKGLGRQTKSILSGSGRLKRAVNTSLKLATFERIRLSVTDVPYAEIHNRGGRAGRNGSALIPQREFMGDSVALRKKLREKLKNVVDQIWQA